MLIMEIRGISGNNTINYEESFSSGHPYKYLQLPNAFEDWHKGGGRGGGRRQVELKGMV